VSDCGRPPHYAIVQPLRAGIKGGLGARRCGCLVCKGLWSVHARHGFRPPFSRTLFGSVMQNLDDHRVSPRGDGHGRAHPRPVTPAINSQLRSALRRRQQAWRKAAPMSAPASERKTAPINRLLLSAESRAASSSSSFQVRCRPTGPASGAFRPPYSSRLPLQLHARDRPPREPMPVLIASSDRRLWDGGAPWQHTANGLHEVHVWLL